MIEELEFVGNYDHYQVSMNPTVPTFVIVLIDHHDRNRFTHNWRRTHGSFHRVWGGVIEDEMSLNQELMIILMEECGELIQACSKAIRCNSYYRNEKLVEEVGDVMCMLELLEENNIINWTDVDERVFKKKKKLIFLHLV